ILGSAGYSVETADCVDAALERFRAADQAGRPFDVVLTDLKMPGDQEGLELLAGVKERLPQTSVILMTAYSTVASAVRAMKLGALDYLPKPFDKETLLHAVEQAREKLTLSRENSRLREAISHERGVRRMIGESPRMQELFRMIGRVARASTNALIRGESGTGKELVARALHYDGPRADQPFLAINCAAIPETLIESELFGHEVGAFTGANKAKAGRFEEVAEGTLFLDEIGSMKFDLQAKLLRVIQEREFSRVGSSKLVPFHGRIVAATAQDLESAVSRGDFREDLYFRLNVVTLDIPPLRERRGDIPILARHFLRRSAERMGLDGLELDDRVLESMQAYDWPGNVRELENCVERMMVLADTPVLGVDLLPPSVAGRGVALTIGRAANGHEAGISESPRISDTSDLPGGAIRLPAEGVVLEQMEAELIRQALERTSGRIEPAAQLLGISYKTLQYRIKKYDLQDTKKKYR
ncbi:MAG: sigma-54-dependent Fis family transcriptional regulator, partial [Planctomycetes bacterium]|nr:sigma-54-dependent Fis family transcriptional regulator [Planctomycetota bacterium]